MERVQKYIVPFPTLVGELTPPHHSLCWAHTAPSHPSACSSGIGFCRIHRIH